MNKKEGIAVIALLFWVSNLVAQSGGIYSIKKSSINSGGSTSSGAEYSVQGIVGQSDASEDQTGGDFTVGGGFVPVITLPDHMFSSGFEN